MNYPLELGDAALLFFAACSLPVYNFLHHGLVCPVSDAVHLPHPRHRVIGFQGLRHALGVCVLFYQPKKEFLRLLLDVCKVAVQYPAVSRL